MSTRKRLLALACVQHQGAHITGGESLAHDQGATKDWTYTVPHASKGDFVALAVDTPLAHPSMMIAAEMVPGNHVSANWRTYFSHSATDPSPIGPAAVEGGYSALYAPELGKVPADHSPASGTTDNPRPFFIAEATTDIKDTFLHLVRAG